MIPVDYYIALSAVLFTIGGVGFLVRRNVLSTLLSIELMLNAVNVAFVAFNRAATANHTGQLFAFFLIAAEAADSPRNTDTRRGPSSRSTSTITCGGSGALRGTTVIAWTVPRPLASTHSRSVWPVDGCATRGGK